MIFRNTFFSYILIVVIAIAVWSCGDDNSTNGSPSNNKCTATVTGDTIFTFNSTKGQVNKSTSSSEYSILMATIVDANNDITTLYIWFKDTGKYDTPLDFTKDGNFAQLSFKNGGVAYKSIEGTLTILEKVNNRVKANFSFKAQRQDPSKKVIEVKNGVFDF